MHKHGSDRRICSVRGFRLCSIQARYDFLCIDGPAVVRVFDCLVYFIFFKGNEYTVYPVPDYIILYKYIVLCYVRYKL